MCGAFIFLNGRSNQTPASRGCPDRRAMGTAEAVVRLIDLEFTLTRKRELSTGSRIAFGIGRW